MTAAFGHDLMTAAEFGGVETPFGPIKETPVGWFAYGHLSDLQFRAAFNTATVWTDPLGPMSWHDVIGLAHEWVTLMDGELQVLASNANYPPAAFAVTLLRKLD